MPPKLAQVIADGDFAVIARAAQAGLDNAVALEALIPQRAAGQGDRSV